MSEYFELGSYARPVTARSDAARVWVLRGLVWAYGFNHEEAVACFERAISADPECALAHWGVAYALGPNYNKPWEMFGQAETRSATARTHAAAAAFTQLRQAIELDDNLPYDEPWAWMQPARHAYGALLLEQGRVREAEAVYRADLGLDDALPRPCQHPGNVWSLHGYHECLTALGEHEQAAVISQQLQLALARADVPIAASCYCRLSTGD